MLDVYKLEIESILHFFVGFFINFLIFFISNAKTTFFFCIFIFL